MERSKKLTFFCIVAAALAVMAMATVQDDEKDCADQLANLAACIPFVSGTAKKPTPECCEDTKKVQSAKPKCLCILIKESTDPSMGLPINTTLALQMPSACNIDANASDCPTLLNIPADSPGAKIFKEADGASSTTSGPTSSASSTSSGSSSSLTSSSSSSTDKSSDTKTTSTSSSREVKLGESLLVKIMGLASIAWLFI